MNILLLFLICLTLCNTIFIVLKLLQVERDMIEAKIQHDVTQQIPVRRRKV